MEKEYISKLTMEEAAFLRQYEKEMGQIRQVSPERLGELYGQAFKGEPEAVALLSEQLLPRVLEIAGRHAGKGVYLGDLIQEGNLTLLMTLQNLSEKPKESSFDAYIEEAVEQAIGSFLEEEGSEKEAEDEIARQLNELTEAMEFLTEESGEEFTLEDLSAYTKLSIPQIRQLLKLAGEDLDEDADSKPEQK